jgi:hypothetical protein
VRWRSITLCPTTGISRLIATSEPPPKTALPTTPEFADAIADWPVRVPQQSIVKGLGPTGGRPSTLMKLAFSTEIRSAYARS